MKKTTKADTEEYRAAILKIQEHRLKNPKFKGISIARIRFIRKRTELMLEATHGKNYFLAHNIIKFLNAVHDGTYTLPCRSKCDTPSLVIDVLSAITVGDVRTLRNLAAAVKKVVGRRELEDGKLTFRPTKPGKLATLANAQKSGTVKVSGKDIAAPGISERTAQRIARIAGAKPAKPGRKKKLKLDTSAPRKKPDTAAALHREVESGAKVFWAKRKRKK
jgi:hypothetical protein